MATDQQVPSVSMQIGELAKRASLTADAMRFYERRRLLPKPDNQEYAFGETANVKINDWRPLKVR